MGEPCIPEEAWAAAKAAFLTALHKGAVGTGTPRDADLDDLVMSAVRAAAPLVVAAELRRLAIQHQPRIDPHLSYGERWHREGIERMCAALADRAQELDPIGGAR